MGTKTLMIVTMIIKISEVIDCDDLIEDEDFDIFVFMPNDEDGFGDVDHLEQFVLFKMDLAKLIVMTILCQYKYYY